MKKFSLLMLLAAAAYALTGCIISDYPCITDTENPNYMTNCGMAGPYALHDTKGWAHIIESSQTATDNNADGIYSLFVPFVTQDSTGNQILMDVASSGPLPFAFHNDQYAQGGQKDLLPFTYAAQGVPAGGAYPPDPDPAHFSGVINAPITGNCALGEGPPTGAGFPAFDLVYTTNCAVAVPDISSVTSYFTRTREAGRSLSSQGQRIPMEAKVAFMKATTPVQGGLQYTFNPADIKLTVSQSDGYKKTIDLSPLAGHKFTVDLTKKHMVGNQMLKNQGITGAQLLAITSQLSERRPKLPVTFTWQAFGYTWKNTMFINPNLDAQVIADQLSGIVGESGVGSRRR